MIDTDLIVEALRARGHAVGHVIPTPANAGEFEFQVDGATLSLTEARALIEDDIAAAEASGRPTPLAAQDPAIVAPDDDRL